MRDSALAKRGLIEHGKGLGAVSIAGISSSSAGIGLRSASSSGVISKPWRIEAIMMNKTSLANGCPGQIRRPKPKLAMLGS